MIAESALLSGPGEPVADVQGGWGAASRRRGARAGVPPGRPRRAPRAWWAYLHGGGWTFGDLDSHDHRVAGIAIATGALVVPWRTDSAPSTAPQSSSTTSSPRSAGCASTRAELGGDPRHIAVGGDSAGGNLTAGAALCLRDAGEPAFDLQVLIYPATAPYFDTLSYHENAGASGSRGPTSSGLGQLPRAGPGSPPRPLRRPGHPRRRGPPQSAARAGSSPLLDPLRDEGEVYARALEAAGVPVTLRRYDGAVHGFAAGWPGRGDRAGRSRTSRRRSTRRCGDDAARRAAVGGRSLRRRRCGGGAAVTARRVSPPSAAVLSSPPPRSSPAGSRPRRSCRRRPWGRTRTSDSRACSPRAPSRSAARSPPSR